MNLSEDAVVISGMSGKFPESDNVYEFRDNLSNKVDMVTDDDRRWSNFDPEIPRRTGKIKRVDAFDSGFFGIAKRAADFMDPTYRIVLEKSYEAIVDAGYNPCDFERENCSALVAINLIETEPLTIRMTPKNSEAIIRCTRMMAANHIAYHFKLNGAAFNTDTACSSSFQALDAAYQHIKEGICNKAIVCGMNLCLHPYTSVGFVKLGIVSVDGSCKPFDDAANGYVRSEGVVVLVLERCSQAKRIYGEIIHSKTNCDGYKPEGINHPSSKLQKVFLKEFYEECKIDPTALTFIEAHGTGTKVGDLKELNSIDDVFCTNRKKPLYIGTVKSNIGHNEPVSGLCSIVKVLIGFESGFIPPNLNYSTPKKGVESLQKGRLKVVTEKIPWPEDDVFVGINSSGFGGTNGHILLHWNTKGKNLKRKNNFRKLVCVSGRSQKAVQTIFNDVLNHNNDEEFIKLIHQIYRKPILNNPYHGYMIFEEGLEVEKYIIKKPIDKRKLCIVLNKNSYITQEMLQKIPEFASKLTDIQQVIKQLNSPPNGLGMSIIHLIFADILNNLNIIGITEVISLNNHLQMIADYFNGSSTLSETILKLCTTKSTKFEEIKRNSDGVYAIIGDNLEIKNKIHFTTINHNQLFSHFLSSLGKLYLEGFCMELDRLYPEVTYPVSRGTPMVSPLIRWDHRRPYKFYKYSTENTKTSGRNTVCISEKLPNWGFITGHLIDGRNLFPTSGYLYLAWETLFNTLKKSLSEVTIVFEDVKFLRAATISSEEILTLTVVINRGSHIFSILENDVISATGKIFCSNPEGHMQKLHLLEEEKIFMDQKDVYKELWLRGYNLQDEYKAIRKYGINGTSASISWTGNWSTFIDNMLQLFLLQQDTRDLYVPTSIKRMVIDTGAHNKITSLCDGEIPVYIYKEINLVSGGGIQITDMGCNIMSREKVAEPVLETYQFVPYHGKLDLAQAVRSLIQIIIENVNTSKVKILEVLKDSKNPEPIMPLVQQTLKDRTLIQSDLKILSKNNNLKLSGIRIENRNLFEESNYDILIIDDVLQNPEIFSIALKVTRNVSGFIISKESNQPSIEIIPQIQILSSYETEKGNLLLIRESCEYIERIPFEISSIDDLSWLEPLKMSINKKNVLYSENSFESGVLGLVNCLRTEPSGRDTTMFLIENGPKFDVNDHFYKSQLRMNLTVNVFKEGKWGSYRHLLLPNIEYVKKEHFYVNTMTRGNLSSLRWIEGPLSVKTKLEPKKALVHVHYSAINFKDLMVATGKLSTVTTKNRVHQEYTLGSEYCGKLENDPSKRVMGILPSGGLATVVLADTNLLWSVPDDWSLEEAATVPVVYATVLYSFIIRGRMKRGQSVLIHSGTGGVGQAAINIATHLDCTIFTTVGTQEKREFIKTHYPQINQDYIGDSRSTSFEQMILKQTKGKGVDFVLNSLTGEKLLASVRCLARNGTFLEISKFDMASDNQVTVALLERQARFEGIMLDQFFIANNKTKEVIGELIKEGIANGSIKPLMRTVFPRDIIQDAFRFMSNGKHMGKVLVKVREEDDNKRPILFKGIPRLTCDQMGCYILVGGLGGIGLELVNWLTSRGVKNLVLTSRTGIKNTYQSYRLNIFKSYGVKVFVRNDDVATEDGCRSLLMFAQSLGLVEGIFNLAVVPRDALFENQTVDNFKISLTPKAYATRYLDLISRKLCPHLKYFVVFSSSTSGRGNPGQTSYGMANSVMEQICEKRKKDGYPALAIQWGTIGDVGFVAETHENKDIVKGGTLPQRISNCLEILDTLLIQNEPIVSSVVIAETKKSGVRGSNILETVLNIMGITNLKAVSHHATFSELGMDSMMVVEMQQTLDRKYQVFLTIQEIHDMTLAKLIVDKE